MKNENNKIKKEELEEVTGGTNVPLSSPKSTEDDDVELPDDIAYYRDKKKVDPFNIHQPLGNNTDTKKM